MKPDETQVHVHDWFYQGSDLSYQKCKCGDILVSQSEYDHRIEEWKAYQEAIRNTPSFKDFLDTKEAYLARNKPKMAEILTRVDARLKDDDYELQHPRFPDPATFTGYRIAGQI